MRRLRLAPRSRDRRGCARILAPPGGPIDRIPPTLLSTRPDSLESLPDFKGDVEFRFNEVVSEGATPNFGLGNGDLERLVVISPSYRVPVVRWKRNRITVHPREGWRPNTVYRVELLPGLADLSNNRSKNGRIVSFTTGAPSPPRRSAAWWSIGKPSGRPFSWPPRRLRPVAESARSRSESIWCGASAVDQNNDFRWAVREPPDSVRWGGTTWGDLGFPPRLHGGRGSPPWRKRSGLSALTFSQPLNPLPAPPGRLGGRLMPGFGAAGAGACKVDPARSTTRRFRSGRRWTPPPRAAPRPTALARTPSSGLAPPTASDRLASRGRSAAARFRVPSAGGWVERDSHPAPPAAPLAGGVRQTGGSLKEPPSHPGALYEVPCMRRNHEPGQDGAGAASCRREAAL